jgi:hypothetical protein
MHDVLLTVNGDSILLMVNKNCGIDEGQLDMMHCGRLIKMMYYWWLFRTEVLMMVNRYDVLITVNGDDALLMVTGNDVLLTVNKNWSINDRQQR